MEQNITKICILSDTHNHVSESLLNTISGNYDDKKIIESIYRTENDDTILLLQKSLPKIKSTPPSLIIHAGDACNQNVLNNLSDITKLIAVQGNCDPEGLKVNNKEIDFFEYINIEGCNIAVAHEPAFLKRAIKGDRFFSPLISEDEPAPDILIHGHTHELKLFNEFSRNTICPGQATITSNHTDLPATLCFAYIHNKKLIYIEAIKL